MNPIVICIFAALFLFPLHIWAGTFQVIPTTLAIDTKNKVGNFQVRNDGEEKVTIQLEVKEWRQDEKGADQYSSTKDIIFFPKIVTLEKGEEKIIRVGYQGPGDVSTERTYRLYLEELPVPKAGETAVRMTLRFGVPIFITPLKENKTQPALEVKVAEGSMQVSVRNAGNQHLIVSAIQATGLDAANHSVFSQDAAGWYVLSGITRSFAVQLPEEGCRQANKFRVVVKITGTRDQRNMETTIPFEAKQCGTKNTNSTSLLP
jgi:fimbrial chaperone protein